MKGKGKFLITAGKQNALYGNSDIMNAIEANDLVLVWYLISLEN